MTHRQHCGILASLLCLFAVSAQATVWQWSVPVTSVTSDETGDHPRAFLWIPPDCQRVHAVVVGQHNMQEEPILEHPTFRAAMSELGVAAVWVSPPFNPFFRFDQGAGDQFEEMMKALAAESGYKELELAPVVPLGHSAMASFPWSFAIWNPDRTLAGISVSGQWPYLKESFRPDYGTRTIDGVPALVCLGEYEWAEEREREGLKERKEHPQTALSMLAEPGAGHFDASDARVEYLELFLKKAVQYRLPADAPLDGPAKLNPIDPTKQGWLAERWKRNNAPTASPAPVGDYKGNPDEAFWYFDEEMAHATEVFQAKYRGRKVALLGYMQNGQVVPQLNGTHQQVTLKFLPQDDGLTFKLSGTFLDTVPAGRPERWTGLKAGSPVEHPESGPIVINRICGPVGKLSDDTFAVRFYRMGMNNHKRTPEIWLAASYPGNDQYRRTVQQSLMRIPFRHTSGADQHITFPEIPDQRVSVKSLKLEATSDAGVPVHYYVREGPAEIEGDTLRFTRIPPRAKFPVKVAVVAWQYGRGTEPRLKTADPVERTFCLTR